MHSRGSRGSSTDNWATGQAAGRGMSRYYWRELRDLVSISGEVPSRSAISLRFLSLQQHSLFVQPWCALGSAFDLHDGRMARRKHADEYERKEARLENDQMGNQTTSCFFWPWIGISIGDGDSPELLHKRPPDFRTLPPHELRLLASYPLLAAALVILGGGGGGGGPSAICPRTLYSTKAIWFPPLQGLVRMVWAIVFLTESVTT
ncbi:hypothetical protein M431DRAFT_388456 [Trichoderma harzianum CBS 226.95]|uniref:Uncharacterized protein n=1 Tax=Trichoderma harzianum CBS 226.95 TaxID=983964 RepID=A0A2T4AIJ3_TRIHA|nr:hypothetical protein M431DRAFT_388456 [Trichoderma harzianum CBS 226.95]PTB56883.1 hypothetical protein M431DRAFT_388456 [Trichoderma harzianum CBS 226.95]